MKRIHFALYAVAGAGGVALGLASVIMAPGSSTAEAHVGRELGAAVVFVGLMSIWCIPNYQRRRPVHLFLIVFTFLMAAIHWYEFTAGVRGVISPLINTVPVLVLTLMLLEGSNDTVEEESTPGPPAVEP